ncbi:unnamed protein product [Mytilus edulis]|uniref:Uncharacterized protein n=1 Tax=Mytilus edulis TaxID=6550 RepID=A0A8S3UWX4_MYTED|nr:unnamed protein product [Mytilus edulis]
MTDYYPDLDDGCNCPACFEAETSIFCFDADFQLVRKSSSGYNWIAPKHEDRFFVHQKLVDDFIKDYDTPKIEKVEREDDFKKFLLTISDIEEELQLSYHGGGKCNKRELPYDRKTIFQRYVLYFYPGLSEPRTWKDAIIPRVNEYLRRPATKQ